MLISELYRGRLAGRLGPVLSMQKQNSWLLAIATETILLTIYNLFHASVAMAAQTYGHLHRQHCFHSQRKTIILQ